MFSDGSFLFSDIFHPFIGDPGTSVCHMDDAAADEAVLFNEVLHNPVVLVGINADMTDLFPAPGKAFGKHTRLLSVSGHTVDRSVRRIKIGRAHV